jgi:hypothetical protein
MSDIDVLVRELSLIATLPPEILTKITSRTIEFLLDPGKSTDYQRCLAELAESQR